MRIGKEHHWGWWKWDPQNSESKKNQLEEPRISRNWAQEDTQVLWSVKWELVPYLDDLSFRPMSVAIVSSHCPSYQSFSEVKHRRFTTHLYCDMFDSSLQARPPIAPGRLIQASVDHLWPRMYREKECPWHPWYPETWRIVTFTNNVV